MALIVIVIGLVVASTGSIDCRVNVSPDRVKKEWVVGDIEYERVPQNETPSNVPYEVLAVSEASTVCITAT